MSLLKKTLFFVGTLILMAFGTAGTLDLNSVFILDDFNDAYGDAANQSTLGAVEGWAKYNKVYQGDFGYWWVYTIASRSWVISGQSTRDTIEKTNTDLLVDGQVLHFFFKHKPDTSSTSDNDKYPSAEVSCNFFKIETETLDLSKMTALSFRLKGTGKIWVGIRGEKIKRAGDWATMGDTISLKSAWTNVNMPVAKFKPTPYSASASAPVVKWDDVKSACYGFQIKSWDSKDAEVSMDSIVFEGMKYSDVLQKVGVRPSFNVQASKTAASISVRNAVVSYTVNALENVSVSLLNANGKEIGNLYTGNASAGTHCVALPKSMNAGTYIVRMNSAQGTVSHKFNLVK
jgi:hypothetical protein